MCGIAGIWFKTEVDSPILDGLEKMVRRLERRGPDAEGIKRYSQAGFGHRRLSIIDLSEGANQPMESADEHYMLSFNGEIYNYEELKTYLKNDYGCVFRTKSDTEVLLSGLIAEGPSFIKKLNGFFAFAFLDKKANKLLIARDRFGIKPFYYSEKDGCVAFASSLTALSEILDGKQIDGRSLSSYLQLSYIPAPYTIFENAQKLEPAHYVEYDAKDSVKTKYYESPKSTESTKSLSLEDASIQFRSLLRASVKRRLRSDVPLGTFLSGGFDSSVITKLACEELGSVPCFSIGFPDQPFFDESEEAAKVAKHLGAEHHIIELRNKKIEEKLISILDAIDEPFADSSAVLVNLLSEYTRRHVTVALSGDGADELLGGYNKHRALYRSMEKSLINRSLKLSSGVLSNIPEARNSKTLNKLRKVKKYSRGLSLGLNERYLEWARFTSKSRVRSLMIRPHDGLPLDMLIDGNDFNSVLHADMELVLANDMLHKVDLMSMSQSLEVRVPFLDHELVDFIFSLDPKFKLNRTTGKLLLRNTFEKDFPSGFFSSAKKGFEAPLSNWFKGPLQDIRSKYFDPHFLKTQNLFHADAVKIIEQKAISRNSGDAPHTLWALLVFQHWYIRNIS